MTDCIFCKIAKGEIESEKIYQDDYFMIIKDISPRAPIHLLIIPNKHIPSIMSLEESDRELVGMMLYQAKQLAFDYGLDEKGFRIIINNGSAAGQEVDHLHFHFLAGEKLGTFA